MSWSKLGFNGIVVSTGAFKVPRVHHIERRAWAKGTQVQLSPPTNMNLLERWKSLSRNHNLISTSPERSRAPS